VTHRGPFQPRTSCDSVPSLQSLHLRAPSPASRASPPDLRSADCCPWSLYVRRVAGSRASQKHQLLKPPFFLFIQRGATLLCVLFGGISSNAAAQVAAQPAPLMPRRRGADVSLPGRPLHCRCLPSSPPAFEVISGITFQRDVLCDLQELIFFHIPQLVSLMNFITTGTAECLHGSFKYNSYFPNSPCHMPQYISTIKLQGAGESVNIYRERRHIQTFSYSHICPRGNSSSHLLYKLNKTLLNHRKTGFLSLWTPSSLCSYIRHRCFL